MRLLARGACAARRPRISIAHPSSSLHQPHWLIRCVCTFHCAVPLLVNLDFLVSLSLAVTDTPPRSTASSSRSPPRLPPRPPPPPPSRSPPPRSSRSPPPHSRASPNVSSSSDPALVPFAILAALATPIVPVLVLPTILMLVPLALWSRPLVWRSCSCVICPLPHQPQSTHL